MVLKSRISATFQAPPQAVWDKVTDNARTDWRSDLSRVEVLDDRTFVEYTKDGFSTTFTITVKEPFTRYAFEMENGRFTGVWEGKFIPLPDGGVRVDFMEQLEMKNPLLHLIARLFMNLRKMQETYIADLKKALGEEGEMSD